MSLFEFFNTQPLVDAISSISNPHCGNLGLLELVFSYINLLLMFSPVVSVRERKITDALMAAVGTAETLAGKTTKLLKKRIKDIS